MDLTYKISRSVSIPVIASGGCGNLDDIYNVFMYGEADAALAASIFHFREYSVIQAKEYLKEKKVPVRL
jgi:cyclase